MKNNRLNQFLFALILSLGILFGHTSMVLADEEPEVEQTVQDNEVEPTVQIRKADQFGNEVPGAKLTLTGTLDTPNSWSTSDYNVYFLKSDVT